MTIGFAAILPYTLGNWIGAKIFRPGAEGTYRAAAYVIIAISAIYGLPIWG